MRLQAELCHIDEKTVVVRVTAWEGQELLGSSLGQDKNVHLAEDKAVERIFKRLSQNPQRDISKDSKSDINISTPERNIINNIAENTSIDAPDKNLNENELSTDPNDWSSELSKIDLNIKRIGWDRIKENKFIKLLFGLSSRNKITDYENICFYLKLIETLEEDISIENAYNNNLRTILMQQNDSILKKLKLDNKKAQELLLDKFKVKSRKLLDDNSLIQFNLVLEDMLT